MATSRKKTTAPAAPADSGAAAVAAPPAKAPAAKVAPVKAAGKAAKAVDPAIQASKEALAKALAAAQAVKIEKPLGKPGKADGAEKAPKAPKARKPKLVRDSFTMPEKEYAHLAELKKRLLEKGVAAKKSELLRAGLALLVAQGDAGLVAAVKGVEVIKTGRPAKSGK